MPWVDDTPLKLDSYRDLIGYAGILLFVVVVVYLGAYGLSQLSHRNLTILCVFLILIAGLGIPAAYILGLEKAKGLAEGFEYAATLMGTAVKDLHRQPRRPIPSPRIPTLPAGSEIESGEIVVITPDGSAEPINM